MHLPIRKFTFIYAHDTAVYLNLSFVIYIFNCSSDNNYFLISQTSAQCVTNLYLKNEMITIEES